MTVNSIIPGHNETRDFIAFHIFKSTYSLQIRDKVLIFNYIYKIERFISPIIFKGCHLPLDKLKKET